MTLSFHKLCNSSATMCSYLPTLRRLRRDLCQNRFQEHSVPLCSQIHLKKFSVAVSFRRSTLVATTAPDIAKRRREDKGNQTFGAGISAILMGDLPHLLCLSQQLLQATKFAKFAAFCRLDVVGCCKVGGGSGV
jgi:hypothetical protein